MPKESTRPRVVIVGAGFGGLSAAKRLANKPVDVTIVDRRNHHLFQPLLYQVATAALSPADIAAPIRSILSNARNVRVLLDEVVDVDSAKDKVWLASGGSLDYDWLILATGARHSYFGRDEWAAHAPGLKSVEDAVAIRRKVLLALERAESELDEERRRALLTFVVIGAGPTGVEMAGAIAELARRSISRDFRSITPQCSRVILVEAGERVLPTFPEPLSDTAARSLVDLGVEIRRGAPVLDVGDGYVQIGNELIFACTTVWAAGVRASPVAEWLDAGHDAHGRVFVEADLRVAPHERIFAIGDTANAAGADRRALPAVAPVAKQQGKFVADVILGRRRGAFVYRDLGNLATIGRSKAVIDWGPLQLSGFAAWLIWSVAHIWFLIGFRSRIGVAISWLWSYATYQRSARLITGEQPLLQTEPNRLPTLERKCA
ncbi:MAG TPA: NAD(P)/FAD-dependent oxidoreductase [Sphingomicrobium sp.]|nr:NAD(P)/FAD-dependent oxidoreductase [Sphingomicrobium sp.]